jgi:hypothetical protein
MKRMLALTTITIMSLGASGVLLAQDNPFVGTWKLNLAKSKFSGTQAPKSEVRTVVTQGDGEKVTYEGVAADGSRIAYSFTTTLDGKDSPFSGAHIFGGDSVAVRRVDANTTASVVKKSGKTLVTLTTVVSKDGRVTTQTAQGTNAQGQPISFTTLWDKQPKGWGEIVDPPVWKTHPNNP